MNGANKGTRMPDMSLKEETIEAQVKEATPIPEGKMFKKKNNLSLEVKDVKVLDDIAEEEVVEVKPVKKEKKKLTEKQLEALKRGREKSIETRRAKREALKQEKQSQKQAIKESNAEVMKMESMDTHSSNKASFAPQKQQQMMPPQGQMMGQGQWDYDKIIRGLADEQDKRSKARENREHQVAEDIKKYENQIRQDERARILAEVEAEEQQEIQQKNTQKTHSIFNPQIPVNAYSRTSYSSFGRSRRNF
tara:strand:- start:1824 stop:2570 length:747 start_codon:yes stop_codon:yes gene_type:complete